jgi:hypothetical protein
MDLYHEILQNAVPLNVLLYMYDLLVFCKMMTDIDDERAVSNTVVLIRTTRSI